MDVKEKRARFMKRVCAMYKDIDATGENLKRFKEKVEPMSDKKFVEYVSRLRDETENLEAYFANLDSKMDMDGFMVAAERVGAKIYHKLVLKDPITGKTFTTPYAYPVLRIPVRRAQQDISKKISVTKSDRKIDAMTGQMAGDDKSSSLSMPEIQIGRTRGLDKCLNELVNVRGGNVRGYMEMKQSLEETGSSKQDSIDPSYKTRVSVMTNILFRSMHLDSNF